MAIQVTYIFFSYLFFFKSCNPPPPPPPSGHISTHVGSQFPNQISNLYLLQWKCRVLTTGIQGKSPLTFSLMTAIIRFIYTVLLFTYIITPFLIIILLCGDCFLVYKNKKKKKRKISLICATLLAQQWTTIHGVAKSWT